MSTPDPSSISTSSRELSPRAQAAARWFRYLARSLRVMRLYREENELTEKARETIAAQLDELLEGGWLEFRIGSSDITLEDEVVVRAVKRRPGSDHLPSPEEELPFLIHQDGVRVLRILKGVPRAEIDVLIDTFKACGRGRDTENDMVTMLWQANLASIQIESVPLEQSIFLSSRRVGGSGGGGGERGHAFALSPSGQELRADLGQTTGAQGLHRDTFDDWELPEAAADVLESYLALLPKMEADRERFKLQWIQEWVSDWNIDAPQVLRQVADLDDKTNTRRALTHFIVTWVVNAFQQRNWVEVQRALELMHEFDPERNMSNGELTDGLNALDSEQLAEQLDTASPDEQARFLGLTVAIGRPALEIALSIMARAQRGRLRAAACTALAYLCDDEPQTLESWLTDMRWYVVRNVVFILGQIGGSNVVGMLRTAAHHHDIRVRRAVVHALGSVSFSERMPILLNMLDTEDPQLLAATLHLMIREQRPDVARELLRRIAGRDFDSRNEECQRSLLFALGEVAGDEVVEALEELLHSGGWFARLTTRRFGVARVLQRIGSEKALAALDAALRSRSEAVRSAALEAVGMRSAS